MTRGTVEPMDMTHRKRVEAAQHESEDRLRFALGAANMVAWDWDLPNGQVVRSENWRDLPCLDTSGLEAFCCRVHTEDRPAVETAIARALSGQSAYDIEFRLY